MKERCYNYKNRKKFVNLRSIKYEKTRIMAGRWKSEKVIMR